MTPQEQAIRDAIATEVVASHEAGRWATRCGYLLSLLDTARTSLPASPPLAPVESEPSDALREWAHRLAFGTDGEPLPDIVFEDGHVDHAESDELRWEWLDRRLVALGPPPSCPPPSPAEGSERARRVTRAAEEVAAAREALEKADVGFDSDHPDPEADAEYDAANARHAAAKEALASALALPAGPPESDAVYREVAEAVRDEVRCAFWSAAGTMPVETAKRIAGYVDLAPIIARVLARRGR